LLREVDYTLNLLSFSAAYAITPQSVATHVAPPAGIVKRGRGRPRKYPLPMGVGPVPSHPQPVTPLTNGKGGKAAAGPRKGAGAPPKVCLPLFLLPPFATND
jgi:hypothetical protein